MTRGSKDNTGQIKPTVADELKKNFMAGRSIKLLEHQFDLAASDIAGLLRSFSNEFEIERDIRYDQLCVVLLNTMHQWANEVQQNGSEIALKQGLMEKHAGILEIVYLQAEKWRALPPRKWSTAKKGRKPPPPGIESAEARSMGLGPDDIPGFSDDDED